MLSVVINLQGQVTHCMRIQGNTTYVLNRHQVAVTTALLLLGDLGWHTEYPAAGTRKYCALRGGTYVLSLIHPLKYLEL